MGRQHIDRLSKKKALIKEFKSGTRVFGLSSGRIILFKAAIIIHNISSRRKEEQRFYPDDSNETTKQSANSQFSSVHQKAETSV